MNSSSQSFAPVSRLLWKEYRVQRAFWLAMLLFGIVPQLLIRAIIPNDRGAPELVWSMAACASLLFVIGSTAILFAGEREERTNDWLRHLAVSPLWVLLAKWGLVLIAALTLGMLLSVSAVMMVWSLPGSQQTDVLELVSRGLWLFAGFFLWGGFGSLVSRRVVTAVPAMGFWWLMTMVVPMVWLPWLFGMTYSDPWHQRTTEILAVLACVGVGVADVWLGWRWCQGRYLDAQVLDDLNTKVTARLNRMLGRAVIVTRIPHRAEFANSWRREWQRLIWQERYRESYHRMLLYVAWMIIGLLACLTVGYQGNPAMPGILPLVLACPLAMGLLGFRYDGEGQPIRFLAGRGISPRVIWMAKHAVWLPRAFWIPLVVCLTAVVAEVLSLPNSFSVHPLRDRLVEAWGNRTAFLLLVLGSYGCGQLAAMLLRRMILAVSVGVALNVCLAAWLFTMLELQVPLWWSVGSVAIWLFALSYWHAPHWLLERRVPRSRWRVAAGVLSVPILLLVSVATWRTTEIAGFGPASPTLFAMQYPSQYWSITQLPQGFEQRRASVIGLQHEIARQLSPLDPGRQADSDKLALAMGGMDKVNDYRDPMDPQAELTDAQRLDLDHAAQERFWAANEPRLKVILEVAQSESAASPSRWLELNTTVFMPQQSLLLEAGRLRTEEGRLDEALNYYCASLRLASFWAAASGITKREAADLQQRQTLQQIIAWASRPDQTVETLKSGRRRVQRELARYPSWRETLVAEYLFEDNLLNYFIGTGNLNTRHSADRRERGFMLLLAEASRKLPWERQRARNLLQQDLLDSEQAAQRIENLLNQPGVDVARYEPLLSTQETSEAAHAHATTPLLPARLKTLDVVLIRREAVVRESLLALSLLIWKLEHGEWPNSLYQLLPIRDADALPMVTVIDPWSGALFHYHGAVVNDLVEPRGRVELLWSIGPRQLREVPFGDPLQGDYRPILPNVNLGLRDWTGGKLAPQHDDRLRVEVVGGRLVLVDR